MVWLVQRSTHGFRYTSLLRDFRALLLEDDTPTYPTVLSSVPHTELIHAHYAHILIFVNFVHTR